MPTPRRHHRLTSPLRTLTTGDLDHIRSSTRPESEYQAVMEAPPGAEAEDSVMEKWPLLDLVDAAVDDLSPRERWIVQAIFWRRMTLRQIGHELNLSKTQVARVRDDALDKLRSQLGCIDSLMETMPE